jgi:uncharacterized repeat protein (TIGR03803 family)
VTKLDSFKAAFVICLLVTVTESASTAQTLKTLVKFDGSNGAYANSILQARDGKLWGTTSGSGPSSCGTVFKMSPTGAFTTAITFSCDKHNNPDGYDPQGLIQGVDGDFYGVSFFGGFGSDDAGTVFKLTPKGVLTVLFSFAPDGSNGSGPVGSLVQGSDGDFYGTTYGGGTAFGYGTVFKITPKGVLTTLYQFDFTHGAQPYAGLAQGTDRNFYGTTYSGGAYGRGTVFKVNPKGTLTVLHSFGETSSDGASPVTPLTLGRDGDFYGATPYGGPDNDGTVFKIMPTGVFINLHDFSETDGRWPTTLVQATDGNFYGTTAYGGVNDADGTIFKMTAAGNLTTLHNFDGADGAGSFGLVQDTNGNFFGLTGVGGDLNCNPPTGCGTVFSFSVSLGPFVVLQPTFGKVGANITILGTNLTGATSVTFNGTEAKFTVVSKSEIKSVVPVGATTGKVNVSTPHGTLISNVKFRVTK